MLSLQSVKTVYRKTSSARLLLSVLFLLVITIAYTHTLDTSGKQQIDKAFNRALITFGISKALNGVISVIQGTEVAIQPVGIGINLTPGQILDPVNDLIERFSWVMLASTTSLGIQKIFLDMSNWPVFNYFFISIIFLTLILLFIPENKSTAFRTFFIRFALILIVLRFIVPIASLTNELIYQIFLQKNYSTSSLVLKSTTQKIDTLNLNGQSIQPDIKKKSVWESARAFYYSTSEMLDINHRIQKYKQAAAETTRHTINLIVVFIFQTIIVPLLFFLILFSLGKRILRMDLSLFN
ncbi:hypothetical protein JYT31_00485 [Beggiatoa alba]|nr:hypothetical protein [Beggiatoa alba]